jgi:hypothetical protein
VDLASIIAARKAALAGLIARRDGLEIEARSILEQVEAEHRTGLTEEETTRHLDLLQQRGVIAEQITAAEADLVTYRHMQEERVERGKKLEQLEQRAAGTGAFSALVVPEYLTDLYAPKARAGRPFADACRTTTCPRRA